MQNLYNRLPRWLRIVRALLGLMIGCVIALALAEGYFRYILFSDNDFARAQSSRLRKPLLFADPGSDVDYFKLTALWDKRTPNKRFIPRDPKLGWMHPKIRMPGYRHASVRQAKSRRPFLFYGDSFTACAVPPTGCWESLIARTPLGNELQTLNYGIGAYGLGQISLLFEESIETYQHRQPIVAIGIFVDNDLDRTIFDFRGCPKPRYRVEDGELAVDLPGDFDIAQWLEDNPPSITSYIVRYFTHHKRWLPRSLEPPGSNHPAIVAQKKALNLAILESLHRNLESRELDYFFVLFFGRNTWRHSKPTGWREIFIINSLDALGIPWVSSRRAMQESAIKRVNETGQSVQQDYFFEKGPNKSGHYKTLGNKAVLPAIIRGLLGEYDGLVKERDTHIPTTPPTFVHSQKQSEQIENSDQRD